MGLRDKSGDLLDGKSLYSDMAEALKLASGSAKAKLEEFLQEIEAAGAKEPAKDNPLVKVTLLEMQPASQSEILYTRHRGSGHGADHGNTLAQQGGQCLARELVRPRRVSRV